MGLNFTKILNSPAIAFDSNIFIYAIEHDRDFRGLGNLFRRLPKALCRVFTSVITVTEITVPLYRSNQLHKIPKYLEFVSGKGRITIVPVHQSVALKAAEYRAKYRFKTPDAIQLATASLNYASFFITADRDFKRNIVDEVKIEKI